jgi:hypothetical protein
MHVAEAEDGIWSEEAADVVEIGVIATGRFRASGSYPVCCCFLEGFVRLEVCHGWSIVYEVNRSQQQIGSLHRQHKRLWDGAPYIQCTVQRGLPSLKLCDCLRRPAAVMVGMLLLDGLNSR